MCCFAQPPGCSRPQVWPGPQSSNAVSCIARVEPMVPGSIICGRWPFVAPAPALHPPTRARRWLEHRSSTCSCSSSLLEAASPQPSRAWTWATPRPVHAPSRTRRATAHASIDRNGAHTSWDQPAESSEYTVVLDRPMGGAMGLTLAPDAASGQLVVQGIKDGSPAASCRRIQVGDVVSKCSAAFSEDVRRGGSRVWRPVDLRRLRWALDSRMDQVKLVLQHPSAPASTASPPVWYRRGKGGRASTFTSGPRPSPSTKPPQKGPAQLLSSFSLGSRQEGRVDRQLEAEGPGVGGRQAAGPGRCLSVGFHQGSREEPEPSQARTHAQMQRSPRRLPSARQARLQALRAELVQAASQAELDLAKEVSRLIERPGYSPKLDAAFARNGSNSNSSSSNSSSSNRSSGARGRRGSPATSGPDGLDKTPTKKKVLPFLPWMLITSTRLDTRDLTSLASARGLGTLLELSLTTSARGGHLAVKGTEEGLQDVSVNVSSLMSSDDSSDELGGGGRGASSSLAPVNGTLADTGRVLSSSSSSSRARGTAGAQEGEGEVRLLIHAAACLQRLAIRRLGSFSHTSSSKERCALLLHCADEVGPKIGNLLAAWLHWYGHMPLSEAILATELALGSIVQQLLLEEATEQLLRQAEERRSQVVLSWRHRALAVSVAGDIVGGWHKSVSMMHCSNTYGCKGSTSRGSFFLPLTGLQPGTYFYKFIVDGTWAVDPFAPKAIDNYGNLNNVFKVDAWPPPMTSKDKLWLARCQAANLALESKMMGGGGS